MSSDSGGATPSTSSKVLLAQLEEHEPSKLGVIGSSPIGDIGSVTQSVEYPAFNR